MRTIDNRKLIEAMRKKRRIRLYLEESLFLAGLFIGAALLLLLHWVGWV